MLQKEISGEDVSEESEDGNGGSVIRMKSMTKGSIVPAF